MRLVPFVPLHDTLHAVLSLALACAFASLAWPLAALLLMRAGRVRPAPGERFDAIVVLGARVRPDGSASVSLRRRVALGCELLRAGHAPKLVVTGGRVGGPITEAAAALAYVEGAELAPRGALVLEEAATSTRTNATSTRALLGDASVLVVTDDWHVPRSRMLFSRSFSRVACAGAPATIRGALREVVVLMVDALRR